MRLLVALLVGVAIGAGATLYLVRSGSGDFLVGRTERVEDLERQLRAAELQRDQLGRQLNDVVARAGRMEAAFADLERRFHDLESARAGQPPSN
ncbi:MAG TPA: hypothetical protein VKU61_04745 [Candidatus Binatia bacterium]|nr:hypothetical protein [Candidatus Binatia bacterium]